MNELIVESTKDYLLLMRSGIDVTSLKDKSERLYAYWCTLEQRIIQITEQINEDNLWYNLCELIDLDSKLCIVKSLYAEKEKSGFFDTISYEEIIEFSHTDSGYYNHEMCGYNLKEQGHTSIIFFASNIAASKRIFQKERQEKTSA